MRRARPRERAATEQRAAQIRPAAAGATDDALRRPLHRRVPGVEDARLDEHAESGFVPGDVELVASGAVERAATVGADLRVDPELAQQREGTPCDAGGREIEVESDLSTAAEMDRPGRVEERRDLGEPAAASLRRDRGELGAEIVRESHGPRARETALVLDAELAVPADPAHGDDPVAGHEQREAVLGAEGAGRPGGSGAAGERRELAVADDLAPRDASERPGERGLERRPPVLVERTSANETGSPPK